MKAPQSTVVIVLNDQYLEALNDLCAEKEASQSQVIRRALALYQMVELRLKKGEQFAFTKDGVLVTEEMSMLHTEITRT